MYIVTSYDGDLPSVWSATAPTEQVVCRARVLARSALDYMEKALMKDFKDNVLVTVFSSHLLIMSVEIKATLKRAYVLQAAFVPSLKGYDVIIHLQAHLVPYSLERVDKRPSPKALPDTVVEQVVPPVEFHPVHKYLEELRVRVTIFFLN